jgi:hypothetical protein
MAVTIQVQFELPAPGECFVADGTFVAGLVLCDVPYQELGSQEHLAANGTFEATLVLPVQHHVPGTDK